MSLFSMLERSMSVATCISSIRALALTDPVASSDAPTSFAELSENVRVRQPKSKLKAKPNVTAADKTRIELPGCAIKANVRTKRSSPVCHLPSSPNVPSWVSRQSYQRHPYSCPKNEKTRTPRGTRASAGAERSSQAVVAAAELSFTRFASTNSITARRAWSPGRKPSFKIRVYPPGR